MCEAFNCFDKAEVGAPLAQYSIPREEVFNKTLAFYCVLLEKGCSFDVEKDGIEFDDLVESEETDGETSSTEDSEDITSYDSRRKHSAFRCPGQMVICLTRHGRPYIR